MSGNHTGLCFSNLRRALRTGAGVAAGVVGAVVYSDWLFVEPTIGRELSPVRSYVSELGALSMPHHAVVNVLDVLCGACVFLFAVRLSRALPRAGRARLGAIGLGVFGLTTALNGLWPMTCAPSRDQGCSAGGLALHAARQDQAATALSVVANLAVLASMFWLVTALATTPDWQRVARAGRLLLFATVPLTLAVGLLGVLEGSVGLLQRLLVLLQSAWIVVLALITRVHTAADRDAADSAVRPR